MGGGRREEKVEIEEKRRGERERANIRRRSFLASFRPSLSPAEVRCQNPKCEEDIFESFSRSGWNGGLWGERKGSDGRYFYLTASEHISN